MHKEACECAMFAKFKEIKHNSQHLDLKIREIFRRTALCHPTTVIAPHTPYI